MIRRPPRSTLSSSSAASDVYKRQVSPQSTGGSCRSVMESPVRAPQVVVTTPRRSPWDQVAVTRDDVERPEERMKRLNHELAKAQLAMLDAPTRAEKKQLRTRCRALDAEIGNEHNDYKDILCSSKASGHVPAACIASFEAFAPEGMVEPGVTLEDMFQEVCDDEPDGDDGPLMGCDTNFACRGPHMTLPERALARTQHLERAAKFRTRAARLQHSRSSAPVSYTHLRAHETPEHLVCRLLLEKKKNNTILIYSITNQ
eukprot:TRINITY_DN6402_c0_g1_i1.p1 TRINITY_DN6402_c0_g1~~TRINITY_DN6402_c0_g1_i1.p1  ORF type:complete len:258 (-),score=52.27 TRINITY_DN6402_c0_g1_i1:9-782(-)